jgi:DNA-binding GntR family transcriptional regulator
MQIEEPPRMMKLSAPLAKTYLGESVYEAVLENIVSGALPSGAELSEVGLAAELQVSRTPVHEALQKLSKDGLVVHRRGRRPRVARFDRAEIAELYEMRRILEGAAAERAATRMDPDELRGLRKRADELSRARGAEGDWRRRALDFDQDFHDALARASGCRRLRDDVQRYRLLVRAFCRMTGSAANLREALGEHLRVLRALEARDSAAARKAMSDHIDARLAVVMKDAAP